MDDSRPDDGGPEEGPEQLEGAIRAAFGDAATSGAPSVLARIDARGERAPRVLLRDLADQETPLLKPTSPASADAAGRYQAVGEVARGGVGTILKVRDVDLGRDVAMKVLHERHGDDPELLQRFVEEAQIGGQLQHPGIVPVYELGLQSDGRPYFAMKLVKGETLAALLAKRADPSEDRAHFVRIFQQICETVAYAHARGVIHRDLKPSNVMVGAFGEVVVVDWGFAKVLEHGGVADEKRAARRHVAVSIIETVRSGSSGSDSHAGSVMGTPGYMPPEQALGDIEKLDERSDVFSLGAILCEILTGEPPYRGDSGEVIVEAARARLDDAYARLDQCGADETLVEITKRCLAANRAVRLADAGAVARRVAAWIASREERLREKELQAAAAEAKAAEERRARRRTLGLGAALVVALIVGAVGFVAAERHRATQEQQAAQVATAALTRAELLEARALETEDLTLWADARIAVRQAGAPTVRERIERFAERADRVLALQSRAREEMRTGEHDRAIETWREVTEVWPDYAHGHGYLGQLLHATERYEEAVLHLRRSRDLRPGEVNCDRLVRALGALGRYADALQAAHDHIELLPDLAAVHNDLAGALAAFNDEEGMLNAYRKALSLDPSDHGARVNVMTFFRNAVRGRKARLLTGDLFPPESRYRLMMALQSWSLDRPVEAVRLLESAAEVDPDCLGRPVDGKPPRLFGAVASMEAGTATGEDVSELDAEARRAYREKARRWLAAELEDMERRLERDGLAAVPGIAQPISVWGNHGRARRLWNPRDLPEVEAEEIEAHAALTARCRALYERLVSQVVEHWADPRASDIAVPSLLTQVGLVFFRRGDYESALQAYERAHEHGRAFPAGGRFDYERPIREVKRRLGLAARIPDALAERGASPAPADLVSMAEISGSRGNYADSVALYERLFRTHPEFRPPASTHRIPGVVRYNAACSAVRLASTTDEAPEAAALRARALGWIRLALEWHGGAIDIASDDDRRRLIRGLAWWQQDPDLDSVRDAARLKDLPEDEAKAWRELWEQVETLLERVRSD